MQHNIAAKTAILVIGDEILTGRTQDTNVQFLAKELAAIGLPVAEVRVVADDRAAIIAAVNALRPLYRYVFSTGGIGPTHDDITSESMAAAFGVDLIEDAEALRRLEVHYKNMPGAVNAARRRMALVPKGAVLVDNPVSSAPGYCIENVFVFAGVPNIMQAMFLGIKNTLQGGPPLETITVRCPIFEGDLAAQLAAVAADFPELSFGSYPNLINGRPVTSLVVRGFDMGQLAQAKDALCSMIKQLGAEPEMLA